MRIQLLASAVIAVLVLPDVNLLRAQGQPPRIIGSTIVNMASFIPPGLPNHGLAQGSLFTLIFQALGPSATIANSPLPLKLAGASMQIMVAGATVDVPMVFAGPASLVGIVPSATPTGDGTITVTLNGQTSTPAPITIVPAAFGIFTLNHVGAGPGIFTGPDAALDTAHLIGLSPLDGALVGNSLVSAAHAGDQLVIWGTGLGADLNVLAEVYVGNIRADVASQGRASCCDGVDQIQFTVPDGLEGCYVPLAVKIGAVVSNFATLSISPDGDVCSDPTGWSISDLQSAAGGAPRNIAEVTLTQVTGNFSFPGIGTAQGTIDFGNGGLVRYTGPLGVRTAMTGPALDIPVPSSGCFVFPFQTDGTLFGNFLPNSRDLPIGRDAAFQFLDAGSALNITGPAGVKQLPKNPNQGRGPTDEYKVPGSAIGGGVPPLVPAAPAYLMPGTYTVDNGAGGTDVKGFQAALTIPDNPASWTGQDAITNIDRMQDLAITWSGSGPVVILGNAQNPAAGLGAQFACAASDADNGSFTVPAWVLSALPPSGTATDVPVPVGFLAVGTELIAPARFQAPGIDIGYFDWAVIQIKNVNFQ